MSHESALLTAVRVRDIAGALELLRSRDKIDVDACDESGRTALHLAADDASLQPVVEALIRRGASVNVPNAHGNTPLHRAAKHGHTEIAMTLLREGANVHLRNQRGESAAESSRTEALRQALLEGHTPQAAEEEGADDAPLEAPMVPQAAASQATTAADEAERRRREERSAKEKAVREAYRRSAQDLRRQSDASTGAARALSWDVFVQRHATDDGDKRKAAAGGRGGGGGHGGGHGGAKLVAQKQQEQAARAAQRKQRARSGGAVAASGGDSSAESMQAAARKQAATSTQAEASPQAATEGPALSTAPLPPWLARSRSGAESSPHVAGDDALAAAQARDVRGAAAKGTAVPRRGSAPTQRSKAEPASGGTTPRRHSSQERPSTPAARQPSVEASEAGWGGWLVQRLQRRVLQVVAVTGLAEHPSAAPRDAAAALAADLEDVQSPLGSEVSAFVQDFKRSSEAALLQLEAAADAGTGGLAEAGAEAAPADDGMEAPRSAAEVALAEHAARALDFESRLLDVVYGDGRAQAVEAQTAGEPPAGSLAVLDVLQRAYLPRIEPQLRALHARARGARAEALRTTLHALRLRHPELIGLREALVSASGGGAPCSTVLEASWLYGEATEALKALPAERTAVGKVRVLKAAMEHIVKATAGRVAELSADDLVPLVTLVLVASRLDHLEFESFLLEEVLSEMLTGGHEGYAVCTVQVSLGFLRHLEVTPSE